MYRSLSWLLVWCLWFPLAASAQTSLTLDLDGDGRTEVIALARSQLSVQGRSTRGAIRLGAAPRSRGLETVVLSPRLALVGVALKTGPAAKCYDFYRYRGGTLEAVPVEVADDDFTDNRICTGPTASVRWLDLTADGTAELVAEERLGGRNTYRRRVYGYSEGAWNAIPLLSGIVSDGIPVLPQLLGTYYRPEAAVALENLQDLQVLRTSPALIVGVTQTGGPYQISLRTPASETSLWVTGAQRSVDIKRGEQVLTLGVSAAGRGGRILFNSATDLADPPLVVIGLGQNADGLYRPAPYAPQWPTPEAYLAQGVLVGTWTPLGNVGLVPRESLRVEPGPAAAAVVVSSRPGALNVNLAAAGPAYDFALASEAGPGFLVDLRGADFAAIAPARCAFDVSRSLVCTATGSPVLYRRRDAPG